MSSVPRVMAITRWQGKDDQQDVDRDRRVDGTSRRAVSCQKETQTRAKETKDTLTQEKKGYWQGIYDKTVLDLDTG